METYIHVVTPELNPTHSWRLILVNPLRSAIYVSSYNSKVSDDTMCHKISRRYGYLGKTERLKSIRIDWLLQWFVIGEFMTKGNIDQSLFQYPCFCQTDCDVLIMTLFHVDIIHEFMRTLAQTHAFRMCKTNYTPQNTVGCNYLSMF